MGFLLTVTGYCTGKSYNTYENMTHFSGWELGVYKSQFGDEQANPTRKMMLGTYLACVKANKSGCHRRASTFKINQ